MSPRKIALFRALQLGDLLCATPAFRAIRHAHPQAKITLIGLPWARDFAQRLAYIDDFVEFPGFPGLPERAPDLERLPHFFAAAQARRFDLVIQMHGSGGLSNPLAAALGGRRTAGFHVPGAWCPDPESFLPWPEELPEVRRLLALTDFLGMPAQGEELELPILPAERSAFARLKADLPPGPQGYAVVHAGAQLESRRWLPERFAAVADRLAEAGCAVLLTGTAGEAGLTRAIRERMRRPAIDLAGHTTLGVLAALVAEARLAVCNDTGVSHVAAAVGTPSVVVCSGADPARWRPLDTGRHRMLWHPVPCRPCTHASCPTQHECAHGVPAETVIGAALGILDTTNETTRETRHA